LSKSFYIRFSHTSLLVFLSYTDVLTSEVQQYLVFCLTYRQSTSTVSPCLRTTCTWVIVMRISWLNIIAMTTV